MKRVMTLCVLVLTLTMALCPAALAADLGSAATAAQVCYLNVYADFDLDVGEVCDALTVIQVCGDGSEETYRYPLTEEDRSILRAKMNDYCMEQTGMSLDDYRAQYLDEEMCSSSFPDGQTM